MGYLSEKDTDEFVQTVGKILTSYSDELGSFTRQQAYLMVINRSNETVDKLLFRLEKTGWIWKSVKDPDHFTSSAVVPFDEEMVKALWPVLIHKGDLIIGSDRLWIGRGNYPVKLSYLLDGKYYDVIILDDDCRAKLIYVDREYEKEKDSKYGDHKYVFVVPDAAFVKTLPEIRAPHIFAVVNEENANDPVRFLEG